MFDANMRYLPKGMEFFGEFRGVDKDHPLYEVASTHKVVLCTMHSKGHENPLVEFHLPNGKSIQMNDEACGCGTWIVYAGRLNGRGFLPNFPEIRKAAKAYLENYYPHLLPNWNNGSE